MSFKYPGIFVSFEGCEASGKSTQVGLLKHHLEASGMLVLATKEPGGTDLANDIRSIILKQEITDPLTESLLLNAARRDHTQKIKAHLEAGYCVISDRYADSSRVYQGLVKGADPAILEQLITWATDGLEPDLTILLDAEITEIRGRIGLSSEHNSFYDTKAAGFHQLVRGGFLELSRRFPNRIRPLNANQNKNSLHKEILQLIEELTVAHQQKSP